MEIPKIIGNKFRLTANEETPRRAAYLLLCVLFPRRLTRLENIQRRIFLRADKNSISTASFEGAYMYDVRTEWGAKRGMCPTTIQRSIGQISDYVDITHGIPLSTCSAQEVKKAPEKLERSPLLPR